MKNEALLSERPKAFVEMKNEALSSKKLRTLAEMEIEASLAEVTQKSTAVRCPDTMIKQGGWRFGIIPMLNHGVTSLKKFVANKIHRLKKADGAPMV
jgi:hypothetical protein